MKKILSKSIVSLLFICLLVGTCVLSSSVRTVEAKGSRNYINYANYSGYTINKEYELVTSTDNTVYVVIYKSNAGAAYERTNYYGTALKHRYGTTSTLEFEESYSSAYDISISIARTTSISGTIVGNGVIGSVKTAIGASAGVGFKEGSGAKFSIDASTPTGTYQIAECAYVTHYLVDVYSANMVTKTVITKTWKETVVTTELIQEGFYADRNMGYSGLELLIQEDSNKTPFYELVRVGD